MAGVPSDDDLPKCVLCHMTLRSKNELQLHYLQSCAGYDLSEAGGPMNVGSRKAGGPRVRMRQNYGSGGGGGGGYDRSSDRRPVPSSNYDRSDRSGRAAVSGGNEPFIDLSQHQVQFVWFPSDPKIQENKVTLLSFSTGGIHHIELFKSIHYESTMFISSAVWIEVGKYSDGEIMQGDEILKIEPFEVSADSKEVCLITRENSQPGPPTATPITVKENKTTEIKKTGKGLKISEQQGNQSIKQIEKSIEQIQTTVSTEQQKAVSLAKRCQVLESKNQMLESQHQLMESQNQSLQTTLRTLTLQIQSLASQNQSLQTALSSQMQALTSQNQNLQAAISAEQQKTDSLLDRIKTLEDTVERLWAISREEIQLSNNIVGTGGWGYVKEATFRGRRVAAKCLHEAIVSPHNQDLFVKEMKISARCRHKNLVEFIGAVPDHPAIIVIEMMDCTLRLALTDGRATPNHIHPICINVAQGLAYLHGIQPNPIIHRDVSAPNVLLKAVATGWIAKLSDLGSAQFANIAQTLAPGCVLYAAPEVQQRESARDQTVKMDVFSFGVLLIEILTREMPTGTIAELITTIQPLWPRFVPLIQRCTNGNPNNRPTMREVIATLNTIVI